MMFSEKVIIVADADKEGTPITWDLFGKYISLMSDEQKQSPVAICELDDLGEEFYSVRSMMCIFEEDNDTPLDDLSTVLILDKRSGEDITGGGGPPVN